MKMKVKIEDNLYLESDAYQYILREYSGKTYTDKDGKEREGSRVLGYYGTVQQAIESLVQMKLRESTATTLTELKEDLEKIRQFIKSKVDF